MVGGSRCSGQGEHPVPGTVSDGEDGEVEVHPPGGGVVQLWARCVDQARAKSELAMLRRPTSSAGARSSGYRPAIRRREATARRASPVQSR